MLIHKNNHNIGDTDQEALMREVIAYFDHESTGVKEFTQMSMGWKNTAESISNSITIRKDSDDLLGAVISWQQEEKDIALKLSKTLGLLVKVPSKQDIHERYKKDINTLLEKNILSTKLLLDGIVSPIVIEADFKNRSVSMSVIVNTPDKQVKGKTSWIRNQLEKCKDKEPEHWQEIEKDLNVNFDIKYTKKTFNCSVNNIEDVIDYCLKVEPQKDITGYTIVYLKSFGNKFQHRKDFITIIEKMILAFYPGIVQFLSNPPKPIPKVMPKEAISIEG